MRHVNRTALVPYKAREMFVLVDDVAAYPEFLPWCKSAEVHKRTDDLVEATLELRKGAVSNKFTTQNKRAEYQSIGISLVGGPFRHLEGGWKFSELGEEGCKVSLKLDFEFENMIVSPGYGSMRSPSTNIGAPSVR